MTADNSPAVDTALAYHRAWTSDDFELAMTHIADDVVCDAPAGRVEGSAAFRAFMGPFAQILTDSNLIAAFGDDETALLMYDTATIPGRNAPGAECLTVRDGKITHRRRAAGPPVTGRRAGWTSICCPGLQAAPAVAYRP